MPDILQLANVTAGYGATVILEDVSSRCRTVRRLPSLDATAWERPR